MSNRYGLQVRAAAAADAPGIAELFAACGVVVPAERLAARLDALGRDGLALIAVEWGPPSGLAVVGWRRSLLADAPVAVLDTLLVAPDDRRRGIGRLLLKAASQAARQAGCDELRVGEGKIGDGGTAADPSLPAFLDATGFARIGALHARPLRRR